MFGDGCCIQTMKMTRQIYLQTARIQHYTDPSRLPFELCKLQFLKQRSWKIQVFKSSIEDCTQTGPSMKKDRYVPITFSCLAIPQSLSSLAVFMQRPQPFFFNPLSFKLPLVIFNLNFCFSFEFIKPLATVLW
ncbi:hypothetical protein OIU76_019870 [Salix suchowensis]|nr:hypothetical protein OIU76_019870 [Salix suchowensis]